MTKRAQQIDGEFWFGATYVATLFKTTRRKVETMAMRDIIRSRQEGNDFLIAETDVTRLRRDPAALKTAKDEAALRASPRRTEKIPRNTVYVADDAMKVKAPRGPIGHALKDERKR